MGIFLELFGGLYAIVLAVCSWGPLGTCRRLLSILGFRRRTVRIGIDPTPELRYGIAIALGALTVLWSEGIGQVALGR